MQGTATYTDMILEDTVDEYVLDILKGKYKISEYIATHGLEIVMGKGGTIVHKKTRSKKAPPKPEDFEDEVSWEELDGIEGFEDCVSINRRKGK